MASYAALVSLLNTLSVEQTPRYDYPPIYFDGGLIESLQERVNFLAEFLEGGWRGAEALEGRIADAAHAAEDAVECDILYQFLPGYGSSQDRDRVRSDLLRRDLENIIQDMDSIRDGAMRIKDQSDFHVLPRNPRSAGSASAPHGEKIKMVGLEADKIQIMEELTGHRTTRQVISIAGMGGIGKTMLARNVFDDKLIVEYFHIRAWVVVSQEYDLKEILMRILFSHGPGEGNDRSFQEFVKEMSKNTEETLEELVHKSLSGRRYLIVMDDIWNADVWYKIRRFFPDNNKGSRVIVTTRLSDLAKEISNSTHTMKFLNEDSSWDLLKERVFPKESCPIELEDIGKKIARSCQGLPLAIVVIGGLLAKSSMTPGYWERVAEDVISAIHLSCDDKDRYMNMLHLSYNHLPVHLKPCFLYMGVFREDQEIRVSELTKLWVAEGILKPVRGRIMEDVAEEYFRDLIERNLILVSQWGSNGKIKSFHIHDLLRDLCMREAQKENFFCVVNPYSPDIPQGLDRQRRIVVNKSKSSATKPCFQALQSALRARSLVCNFEEELPPMTFRLLRVLNVVDKYVYKSNDSVGKYPIEDIFRLVNSRYLAFKPCWSLDIFKDFSTYYLRNVQTIVVSGSWTRYAPSSIWRIPQLRHIRFESIYLPEPMSEDNILLDNLQTVMNAEKFRLFQQDCRKTSQHQEIES